MEELETQEERIITVRIKFEEQIEEGHHFQLKEREDIYTLLNYDKIRKKILQEYKYTAKGKDQIKLFIQNFYHNGKVSIPIHHPKNYTFIVKDMINRGVLQISLKVRKMGELKLKDKKKRQKMVPIEFDSEGSIQSVQNQDVKQYINANRPKSLPYQQKDAVRCLFCLKTSRQGRESKIAGPFYGPFTSNTYAHLLCLLWCSDVYLDQQQNLCGVTKAIQNSKKLKCRYCNQKGASFYCHAKACRRAGHYKCALENNWHFIWSLYTTYCPECTVIEGYNGEISSRTKTLSLHRSENNCKMDQQQDRC